MNERLIRLLLVDDDDLVRGAVLAWLEDEHFHITEAMSGADALKLLARERFDCVLLDLRLNDMGGIDVIKTAQSTGNNPAWLILTGNLGEDTYQELRALGIPKDAILQKPIFDMGVISTRIRRFVTRRSPAAPVFPPSPRFICRAKIDPPHS